MSTSLTTSRPNIPHKSNQVFLPEAKSWIGRVLLLRKKWLGFKAGTRCRVMCVVDFGDGLLLWITTDDEHSQEIDQVEVSALDECFIPLPIETQPHSLLPSAMSIA